MILGNEGEILRLFNQVSNQNAYVPADGTNEKIFLSVSKGLKRFEAEVAFLIRTFFFVFLGIIVSISSLNTLLFGVVLSIILLAVKGIRSSMDNDVEEFHAERTTNHDCGVD